MIALERLKDLLVTQQYSQLDKILICLAVDPERPRPVSDIRTLAVGNGLRAASRWNVASILSRSRGFAVRTANGWELTTTGRQRIVVLVGPNASSPIPAVASGLRALLASLSSPTTVSFLEEAIRCLENGLLRAATVLSWVGAVHMLYDYVLAQHLPAFNAEALKRDAKWKQAKTADDLARMKEHDFLQVLEAISAIGKSVKHELEGCLKLRNAAGHPNSLKLGEARVAAHVETLTLNVFSELA